MRTRLKTLGLALALAMVAVSTNAHADEKEAGLSSPSDSSSTLQAQNPLETLDLIEAKLVQNYRDIGYTAGALNATTFNEHVARPEVRGTGRVPTPSPASDSRMVSYDSKVLRVSSVFERKPMRAKIPRKQRRLLSSYEGGDNRICPMSSGIAPHG